jgi:hypothetical protein
MLSQKVSPILAPLITALIIIIGIMITGFFAFSPLSYVQIDITIKAWCMFINGLLWMLLSWTVHWIEVKGVKKIQVPYLKELCSGIGKVTNLFYLSIILLKVIMLVLGVSILIISVLQLRSLGTGKFQVGAAIAIFIAVAIISLFLIFQEFSSVHK